MATLSPPAPLSPPIRAIIDAGPAADVIFLPTDGYGTPGQLNSAVLKKLGLPIKLPGERELGEGYALTSTDKGLICFVVTVVGRPTIEALDTNFANALRDPRIQLQASLWVPLMGTGTGGLSHMESFKLILERLTEFPPVRDGRTSAVISIPKEVTAKARARMLADTEEVSAKLNAALLNKSEPPSLPSTQSDNAETSSSALDLPRTTEVHAVLALASQMSRSPQAEHDSLSTSLLFFALAEGTSTSAPGVLSVDPAAETFATAVHELAGPLYEVAWMDYFKSDERIEPFVGLDFTIKPTPNVTSVLVDAHALVGGGEAPIGIDQLITALLCFEKGRHRRVLANMQVDPERLLAAYRDARLGRVAARFQNDVANIDDQLDYGRYATAIHAFLTNKDTKAPLSISIQAPWGGGKSTLMHLLREELDPEEDRNRYKRLSIAELDKLPRLLLDHVAKVFDTGKRIEINPDVPNAADMKQRRWTIWFNAWKYETTEQLWAGLVDAIVSQVAVRLSPLEREKFLLKLQLARIDDGIVRKRIYDRIATTWWNKSRAWVIGGGAAVLSLFGLGTVKPVLPNLLQQIIALGTANGFTGAVVAQIALSIFLIGKFLFTQKETRSEPAKFSLADIIKVPDYDKGVGELHHVHADLHRVLDIVPHLDAEGQPAPLVIFIDDLDRCSPGKVASVVEGVSMLLATSDYRCMFVIGMDPQMVAAALEKAHEDVREKLPSYERAVPLGWRFMDKFVQLPFTLPPSEPAEFAAYVAWLSGRDASLLKPQEVDSAASERGQSVDVIRSPLAPSATPLGIQRRAAVSGAGFAPDSGSPIPTTEPAMPNIDTGFTESRDVGAIIRKIAIYSVGNPREIKRMVNLARFYLTLRAARREKAPDWRAPSLDQYARWIALTLRWPDMLRWLQWGADEAHWPPEELGTALVVRRLRALERHGEKANSLDAWCEALKTDLNVPTEGVSDWARDAKLFEFFTAETKLSSEKRLSDAAGRGFW
ncbi:MAG: hypothetical protein B7Y45_06335 [Sphingomonas sp. 28-66-16]|nr:MAG: hypothetical protein B7Y45_06335 [Sphingomonas sp. 28-66-16]